MYDPAIVAVPVVVGVKVTEQLPEVRMQVVMLKDPVAPVSLKATLPVGVNGVPGEVSETVAVHDDGSFTTTGLAQLMLVEVVRGLTVMLVEPVLPLWEESPP